MLSIDKSGIKTKPTRKRLFFLTAKKLLSALVISLGCLQMAWADYVVTRAFRSDSGSEFERVFLSEVTRSGGDVSVGAPIMLNPPLPDAVSIWGIAEVPSENQVVYGAFDANTATFDDLFVVDLRMPGVARQLNPTRTDPANEFMVFSEIMEKRLGLFTYY